MDVQNPAHMKKVKNRPESFSSVLKNICSLTFFGGGPHQKIIEIGQNRPFIAESTLQAGFCTMVS